MVLNNCFEFAEEKFFEMAGFLKSEESQNLDLSELENFLHREGRELLKRLLTAHLEERQESQAWRNEWVTGLMITFFASFAICNS